MVTWQLGSSPGVVFTQRNFFLFFFFQNNLFNFERTTEEQRACAGSPLPAGKEALATFSSQNLSKCAFRYAREPMAVVQNIIYARPQKA